MFIKFTIKQLPPFDDLGKETWSPIPLDNTWRLRYSSNGHILIAEQRDGVWTERIHYAFVVEGDDIAVMIDKNTAKLYVNNVQVSNYGLEMDKPDIYEGSIYSYSHSDEIVVNGKIWGRDFYYTPSSNDPLLRFHPTKKRAKKEERPHARRKTISDFIRKFTP